MNSDRLAFSFDELPPSINKLYFPRAGRLVLVTEGKKYKRRFVSARGGCTVENLLQFNLSEEEKLGGKFVLHLTFRIPKEKLYNAKYGKDKRVKSPIRKLDVSNLIKITEDCISEITGIDDRQYWIVVSQKVESESPGIDALLVKGSNIYVCLDRTIERDPLKENK